MNSLYDMVHQENPSLVIVLRHSETRGLSGKGCFKIGLMHQIIFEKLDQSELCTFKDRCLYKSFLIYETVYLLHN